jgi:hypothetical protein
MVTALAVERYLRALNLRTLADKVAEERYLEVARILKDVGMGQIACVLYELYLAKVFGCEDNV